MGSEDSPHRLASIVAGVAVLAVLAAVVGLVASLAITNPLLTGSPMAAAALASVAVVVITLVLVVLAGRPSDRWRRTPYW